MNNRNDHIAPPRLAEKLLLRFLREELAEEVLGDLDEKFYSTSQKYSFRKARRNYWYQVLNYMRPFAFKLFRSKNLNSITMIRHNFKISFRQMLRNKSHSFINIGGLAMGMAVAMLIGLWVNDELTFNAYHTKKDQIVQVIRHDQRSGEINTNQFMPTGVGRLLQESFPDQIRQVVMRRSRSQSRVIANGERKFTQTGLFMESGAPSMLSLQMKFGQHDGLEDLRSIMLSETLANKLFGDENPVNKTVKIDGRADLLVTGVFRDLPQNSTFKETSYIAPLLLLFGGNEERLNIWNNYNVWIYAELEPGTDVAALSAKVNEFIQPHLRNMDKHRSMEFFLHPMADWHLGSDFEDGQPVRSEQLKFVWMYGIIGVFVLLLACINFMNLSTARSEKRAKEVGIRKTIGSIRRQLVAQFYIESLLNCLLAFALALGLFWLLLPWFNETSGKAMAAPWGIQGFWLISLGFLLITALLSGSYPATYLSSFKPITALRGTLGAGKKASLPRKVLVVFQFTISIALIVGTITVNNQIQTAKDRPVGYSPKGMISIRPASPNHGKRRDLLKSEILKTGMATAVGRSNYPVISDLGWNGGFSWEGMDPDFDESFNTISISYGYGDAVGLEFIAGRDFSEDFETDKNGIIINRSAMEAMQLENPVGTIVRYAPGWTTPKNYTIIGVVEDMIKGSPFQTTDQSVMFLEQEFTFWTYIRLNPDVSASTSIPIIQEAFNEVLPDAPFDFQFADDDYNAKFKNEIRIASLASFFAVLAILISCLGLFGLASYVAEQRTKEIGIRKVLGASVASLWRLLSKDFALLVLIACAISIPVAYSVLNGWLEGYEVRTKLHWWIFALAGAGAFVITLITVSFQAIKAAIVNPVKSLRTE